MSFALRTPKPVRALSFAALFLAAGLLFSPVAQAAFNGPGQPSPHAGAPAKQGGFSGPGPALTSAEQARNQPDDAWMTLKGNIVQQIGEKTYLFRDASGEIRVKIGHKAWGGLNVTPADTVEISGEMDKDWMEDMHIDVKRVIKVQ